MGVKSSSRLIHNIRTIINDDEKFRKILIGLNTDFYHQTVTSQQVEEYISQKAGIDFGKVFDQYLRNIQIPQLQYNFSNGKLSYRWKNCIPGFNMKVKVKLAEDTWLSPTTDWQAIATNATSLKVDDNFYISSKEQ